MLRSLFVYLSKAVWARQIVTGWPMTRRMAGRFVAGDTLEDAIQAIQVLNAQGINASLDHLGESTTNATEAIQATEDILVALDAIAASQVRANVSIKLTQVGLKLGVPLCAQNLYRISRHAAELGNFIRVDMEDTPVTQITLDLVRQTCQRLDEENTPSRVGVVIQSYLFRSEADTHDLVQARIPVRLCKGAYQEPARLAFPKKADVDANYDRLAGILLDAAVTQGRRLSPDGKYPPLPALATDDARRIEFAKNYASKIGLSKDCLEFQMLYGIRRDLQLQLTTTGYPVRVYVPYGTHWYPYFMRRLGERPANVWFIISNFFRR